MPKSCVSCIQIDVQTAVMFLFLRHTAVIISPNNVCFSRLRAGELKVIKKKIPHTILIFTAATAKEEEHNKLVVSVMS